ncbi:MAG: barstar family protein [Parasporobacterium sp.]|nr:barstar family protein [Parasporobacterium sp.]
MHYILDAGELNDSRNSHIYLKEIFGFPEYYGCNLDALYDCITELPDVHIHIIHTERGNEYFRKILRVFEESENAAVYLN